MWLPCVKTFPTIPIWMLLTLKVISKVKCQKKGHIQFHKFRVLVSVWVSKVLPGLQKIVVFQNYNFFISHTNPRVWHSLESPLSLSLFKDNSACRDPGERGLWRWLWRVFPHVRGWLEPVAGGPASQGSGTSLLRSVWKRMCSWQCCLGNFSKITLKRLF